MCLDLEIFCLWKVEMLKVTGDFTFLILPLKDGPFQQFLLLLFFFFFKGFFRNSQLSFLPPRFPVGKDYHNLTHMLGTGVLNQEENFGF